MTASSRWAIVAFWTAIVAGIALRFSALGTVPGGLSGDEAEVGVEAIAILTTSMDRWGDVFPVFFPHVGIGMNPLYTYLLVPVFKLFGVSTYNLRVVSAVFGVLTIPATYFAARENYGKRVALIAMALVALLPWQVMVSRWGLEYAILPFWFTLGIFTLSRALKSDSRMSKVWALIPWVIGCYSYVSTVMPVLAIVAVTALVFRKRIAARWRWWALGGVLALILAFPLIAFLIVNVAKLTFPLKLSLPFSIPVLTVSRLAQVTEPKLPMMLKNLSFLIGGYQDNGSLFQSGGLLPLTGAAPLILIGAAIYGVLRSIRSRVPDLMVIIVFAILVPIVTFRLNVGRVIWFYSPSIILSVKLLADIYDALKTKDLRQSVKFGAVLYLGVFTAVFYLHYFSAYNGEVAAQDLDLGNGFRIGLEAPLRAAAAAAGPGEPVFVDAGYEHPYVYVLFYGLADIHSFQTTRKMRPDVDAMYHVTGFDRFIFERSALPPGQPFTFVTLSNRLPCDNPEIATSGPVWSSGECKS